MDILHYFLPLINVSFVAAFTPGPNNIMLMNTGLNRGFRGGIAHAMGVAIGFICLMVVSLFGVSHFIQQVPAIEKTIKHLGSLYLLYLAYKLSPFTIKKKKSDKQENTQTKEGIGFVQALVFQAINPKGVIMLFVLPNVILVDTLERKIIFLIVVITMTFTSAFTWLIGGKLLKNIIKERGLIYINTASFVLLVITVILLYVP